MSEFSDSLHLSSGAEEALALFARAGVSGYVLWPRGRWTALVVAEKYIGDDSSREAIIDANGPDDLLLHYVCAADHGFSFALYRGDRWIARYRCSFETLSIRDRELDPAAIAAVLQVDRDQLEAILRRRPSPGVAHAFAELVGLGDYRWISYRDVADRAAELDASEILDGVPVSGPAV